MKLNIYMLKEGTTTELAVDDANLGAPFPVTAGGAEVGTLYPYRNGVHKPGWISLFPEQATELDDLVTAGAGGLLFIQRERLFALAFGYASPQLNQDVIEEGFGLKVTLNSVPGDQLRSVDAFTPDLLGRRTRTQTSRVGSVPEFGIDVEQDFLRAVTGIPTDRTLAERMTGRDNLVAVKDVELVQIPPLLDRYFSRYQETTYQTDFSWIDKVRELTDRTKMDALNERLVEEFRSGTFDRTWMSVPDLVEWENVAGFRYGSGKRGKLHSDLHVQSLRSSFRDPALIEIQSLQQKQVCAYSDTEQPPSYHWSAFRCIYAEIEEGAETYLLTGGKWFRIETDFVRTITDEIASIPEDVTYPAYNHRSEAEYNAALVASEPTQLTLMDAKNIVYGGGHSKIEFCDCYGLDGRMIHVKRYSGSSVLSHLFQQGVVSADLWAVSPEFREAVNAQLPATHKLSDPRAPIARDRHRVLYGITSNRDRPLSTSLPFFSRLTLRNSARHLRGFGYDIGLIRIFDETDDDSCS